MAVDTKTLSILALDGAVELHAEAFDDGKERGVGRIEPAMAASRPQLDGFKPVRAFISKLVNMQSER